MSEKIRAELEIKTQELEEAAAQQVGEVDELKARVRFQNNKIEALSVSVAGVNRGSLERSLTLTKKPASRCSSGTSRSKISGSNAASISIIMTESNLTAQSNFRRVGGFSCRFKFS